MEASAEEAEAAQGDYLYKERVMKKFTWFLVFLLVFIFASPYARANEIYSIDMDVKIDADGNAHIMEKISGNFYEGTEVYFPFSDLPGGPIKNLKVTEGEVVFTDIGEWNVSASRQEKKYKSGIVGLNSDSQELCFGIGDYGEHTYLMEYDIPSLVINSKDGKNFLFFKFIKDDMDPAPEKARISISAPFEINKDNARIWAFGYEGSVQFEGGKIIAKSQTAMSSSNSMIILTEFEKNPFNVSIVDDRDMESIKNVAMLGSDYTEKNDSYSDGNLNETGYSPYKRSWFSGLLSKLTNFGYVILGFVLAVFASIFSKDSNSPFSKKANLGINLKEFKDYIYYEYPFRDGNMMEFSTMISDAGIYTLRNMIASLVMNGIVESFIEPLRDADRLPGEKSEKTKYAINASKIEIAKAAMNENEKKFYEILISAAGSDHVLETTEIQSYFKKNYSEILEWEKNVYNDSIMWTKEKGYYHVEKKFSGLSRTSTESGDEKLKQIIGFKNYLVQYSMLAERSAIDTKIWDVYMVAATMMGIPEEALKQFAIINPNYAQEMSVDLSTYYMVNSVANSMVRSVKRGRDEAQREESRSSGGGGSSSVGGGSGSFGGGGGGGTR